MNGRSAAPLPIEPLPEAAWQRVEGRVFAQLTRPPERGPLPAARRGWTGLAAASALCLLLAAAWFQHLDTNHTYASGRESRVVQLRDVELRLDPGSELSRHGSVWTLQRGAAEFHVAKRKQRDPLTVLAGDVRVEVVGTVFRVARAGESAVVETREGLVRVQHAGALQLIAAGERWPSAHEQPAATRDEATAAEPAPAEHATPQPAPARHPASASSQRQRFEQAAALEARDVPQALRAYRRLAAETGAWASNALFALARLEAQAGMDGQAVRDLGHYVERYPNGPNAEDARALLSVLHGKGDHAP